MTVALIRYDAAKKALVAASRVDEAKKIRDRAEAVRVYATQARDYDLQNSAVTIRLLAERRVGQLLIDMEKNPGTRGDGRPRKDGIVQRRYLRATAKPPTLEELNISKVQSSKWQRLAKLVDDNTFELALEQAKETFGELTTASVLWAIRDIIKLSVKSHRKQNLTQDRNSYTIHRGNVLDVLPTLPSDHFAGSLSDPPYELGFMRKDWDKSGIAFNPEFWSQMYRVLKPGAYLLAFGGCRTVHRLACAIEDAGFEIRDQLIWLFGTGFPKSKACLKSGYEPIVLARKPAKKGLPLATDTLRVGPGEFMQSGGANFTSSGHAERVKASEPFPSEPHTMWRYPTNVIIDEHVATLIDTQSGERKAGGRVRPGKRKANVYGEFAETSGFIGRNDTGGASRFFYCAKTSAKERDAGLGGFDPRPSYMVANGSKRKTEYRNPHPTVKPLELAKWLATLIKPEANGRLLVPFSGSGSEMIGGLQSGWDEVVGIELSHEFIRTAEARMEHHISGD